MEELLKVNYDNDRITLSARELHEFLEMGTQFKDWFPRMREYGFTEGIDFNPLKIEQVRKEGNRNVKRELQDYEITLDMAKEIAMIQRNEKGKQARQYFIKLEKQWNSPECVMNRALEYSRRQVEQLRLENQELKPKAEYFDELVDRNLLTNFRDTSKELGIRQNDFVNKLLEDKYIYRDQKGKLRPYSQHVEKGLFQIKEVVSISNDNAYIQTLITPKGRETFRLLYSKKDK